MAKRRTSAQTRVKLSQAAKRRRRAPKGTPQGGKFLGAFGSAVRFSTGGKGMKGEGDKFGHPYDKPGEGTKIHGYDRGITNPDQIKEMGHANRADVEHRMKTGQLDPREVARWKTRSDAAGQYGPTVRRSDVSTPQQERVRVSSSDVRNVEQLRRESHWRDEAGIYTQEGAIRPGRRKKYTPTSRFVETELAPSHKSWLESSLEDPSSEFNAGLGMTGARPSGRYKSAGQRNRVRLYTQGLQEGLSHEEAMQRLRSERRGRRPSGGRGAERRTRSARDIGLTDDLPKGRKSKYESVAPSHREFNIGVSARAADDLTKLKDKFPNRTERELVRIQQYQREHIADEIQKNQRWTHETKKANLMGAAARETGPDRVVFFTTNLGYPAPSVPSDSLIGQYIIKKRGKFMQKEGTARAADLKGKFPEAVRDMHVMEMATGISFGAEGRWGAFQKSGWRRGAKRSRNFGKPVPVGQQLLYDSQGRPLYDSEGNIRFTEGATRPFKFETMKDAGFRVFIG